MDKIQQMLSEMDTETKEKLRFMFYPEMGETKPADRFINARISRGGYYLKWLPADHGRVMEAFKAHRVKPSNMEEWTTTKGERKWSANVTSKAFDKLRDNGIAALEALLD